MNRAQTFTGRQRRRGAHPWAKAADVIARGLITTGGLGTILAVLLVSVFLLAVALPLFRPASARLLYSGSLVPAEREKPADRASPSAGAGASAAPDPGGDGAPGEPRASDNPDGSEGVAAPGKAAFDGLPLGKPDSETAVRLLAVDDTGIVALAVTAPGDVFAYEVQTGRVLLDRPAADSGLSGLSAICATPSGAGAVGFEDGTAARLTLALRSTFIAASDLPAPLAAMKAGQAAAWEDSIIVCTRADQFSRIDPIVEVQDRTAVGSGQAETDSPEVVRAVDCVALADGPLLVALAADGAVMVETVSERRNLLTDEIITRVRQGRIPAPEAASGGPPPRFALANELGDQLLLIGEDGRATRWGLRDINSPRLLESVRLAREGRRVAAVARLFGGMAVAVGDDAGGVDIWYPARPVSGGESGESMQDTLPEDGLRLVRAKSLRPSSDAAGAVESLSASSRSRLFAIVYASGRIRLAHSTSAREILAFSLPGPGPATAAIAPRENALVALADGVSTAWRINAGYPEVSASSLFGRVWYEGYPAAVHAWETTGHEAFEPKFGLVPLVFGTLKSTLYSMLFATPIAVFAAIYSSQFMRPAWRARIKPAIETMASLPSVVLGFVAGLIFAPAIEGRVMVFLTALVAVPVALVSAAHLWQMLPGRLRTRWQRLRFPLIAFGAIPAGLAAAALAAPSLENRLFGGDFIAWLDGRGGSGLGGWILTLMPLSGVAVAMAVSRFVAPVLRQAGAAWPVPRVALASLVTFLVGAVFAFALAAAAGVLLDALRFDARGGFFGTYVQRNAMVVAIGMGFAIIPLIFTIADDALSSVPEHLRSASLGAGATPWQTAVRVIVPAAASGIFSAIMIGLGRAVGETMIVLMAAGNTPILNWNLFSGFQTLSAAIATELPEAARGSAHYRVLFLAALTLFLITFVVNTAAELVRQRVRRRSYEL
jgi:phosphate transport system permease protein